MPALLGLLVFAVNIAVFIFLINMVLRLVKAVEHIADKTGKTAQMLEKMVDKLEAGPSSLPAAE